MEEPIPYEKDSNFSEIDDNITTTIYDLKDIVEKEGVLLDDAYQYKPYGRHPKCKLYYIPSTHGVIFSPPAGGYFLGGSFSNTEFERYWDKIKIK